MCSRKGHGQSCLIQWSICLKISFENFSPSHCRRWSHKLLVKGERVVNLEGINSRDSRDSTNDSKHISIVWWEKGETRAPCGSSWWITQKEGLTHYCVHLGNECFGLHHDLQPLLDEELDDFVRTTDHLLIWSLHSQGDWHLWSHLPPILKKHQEEECKANSTISKPCHVTYFKGTGEDSKWTSGDAKGRSY